MVYDVKYHNTFEEKGATNLGMMWPISMCKPKKD
jgi:hypothetical protein